MTNPDDAPIFSATYRWRARPKIKEGWSGALRSAVLMLIPPVHSTAQRGCQRSARIGMRDPTDCVRRQMAQLALRHRAHTQMGRSLW